MLNSWPRSHGIDHSFATVTTGHCTNSLHVGENKVPHEKFFRLFAWNRCRFFRTTVFLSVCNVCTNVYIYTYIYIYLYVCVYIYIFFPWNLEPPKILQTLVIRSSPKHRVLFYTFQTPGTHLWQYVWHVECVTHPAVPATYTPTLLRPGPSVVLLITKKPCIFNR